MTPTDLVDANLLRTMIVVATPLLVAALGELVLERAGILNLAIEGMVTLGAAAAFVVLFAMAGLTGGVALSLLSAATAAAVVGLVLAYLCVGLRANQITVGLGLLIFSLGAASLLYRAVVGVTTSPPRVPTLTPEAVPGLAEIPYLGTVLFRHNLFVYAALLLVVPVWWLLFRTPLGLRIRATGENPKSADSLGLPVQRIRYGAVLAGSALIGLAGAFFPLVLTGGWSESTVGGRGWLALMLVIFGRWRPWQVVAGALLFAYVDAVGFVFAATSRLIPVQFLQMLPYVLAIAVLVQVYQRAQAPAALAKPYDREARY
jgi:simple sugar transport system permease protein